VARCAASSSPNRFFLELAHASRICNAKVTSWLDSMIRVHSPRVRGVTNTHGQRRDASFARQDDPLARVCCGMCVRLCREDTLSRRRGCKAVMFSSRSPPHLVHHALGSSWFWPLLWAGLGSRTSALSPRPSRTGSASSSWCYASFSWEVLIRIARRRDRKKHAGAPCPTSLTQRAIDPM
jgi:hypothetical protein